MDYEFQCFNSTIGVGPYPTNYFPSSSPSASACQGLVSRLLKVPSSPFSTNPPQFSTDALSGNWNLRQELQDQDFYSPLPLFGKMETEVILSSLNGGTGTGTGTGNEFKGDFSNENSRSCSPSIDGQTYENGVKGNKIDASKVCGVCGDKALGNNFNAITCESCKAFFRRNALKPKDFVCPFNDNCKVDPVTRRFCQKCRLKKCFDIGMKKEWIMTDEEKKMKKQKIEQNRLKRQSSDAPPSNGDGPLPKNSCLLVEDQESNSPTQGDPLGDDHHQQHSRGMPEPDPHHYPRVIRHPTQHIVEDVKHNISHHQHQHHQIDPCSYDNSSNSSEGLPTPVSVVHVESTRYLHPSCNHKINNGHGHEHSVLAHRGHSEDPRIHMNGNAPGLWHGDSDRAENSSPSGKIMISQPTGSSGKSRLYGLSQHMSPNLHPHLNGGNELNHTHTPLLTSLIRPGLAESPPDANLVDCSASHIVAKNPATQEWEDKEEEEDKNYKIYAKIGNRHPSSSASTQSSHLHSNSQNQHIQFREREREREFINPSSINGNSNSNSSGSHFANENKSNEEEETIIPLPLNTMDSILSVAITAEYNSFGMLDRNPNGHSSKELNKAERAKLNELRSASQALHAPVDAEGPLKLSETSDLSLINVINLTDIAIRRLIQMSKKISGFKNMCQEDQIALLKGSCTEMMILRSVVSYDPDRDSWNIPHSFGYNINLGVLKEARGNLYEEHQRFVRSFKSNWRIDENIMIILCAITLFTAERPNVIHKDVVKLEQDSYYYLLKRYLESTLNGCEARSTYLQLIRKIAELHELNSNHLRVFLEANPREVEPLLIEIFDLKQ